VGLAGENFSGKTPFFVVMIDFLTKTVYRKADLHRLCVGLESVVSELRYKIPGYWSLKAEMKRTPVVQRLAAHVQADFRKLFLQSKGDELVPKGVARVVHEAIMQYELKHPGVKVANLLGKAIRDHNELHPDKPRSYDTYAEPLIDALVAPGNDEFYKAAVLVYVKEFSGRR